MKISEWERLISSKYKVLSKITNYQDLNYYLNFKSKLLYVLKLDDIIVYVKGTDELITGVFSNNEKLNRELSNVLNIPFFVDLLKEKHKITLEDTIKFLLIKGFVKVESDNLSKEYLEYYFNRTKLNIEGLTEGFIEDKNFYAAYILDDKSIYGEDFEVKTDSEYLHTMVFVESKDKINVTKTFVHSAGFSTADKYGEFLRFLNMNEYNFSELINNN